MSSSESNSSNTNPFLSSSSSDGELQAYYNQWQSTCQQLQQAVQQGGDNAQPESSRRRRRRTHIERGREQGHSQLYKDYFSEIATYPDEVFRRRFRMRKPLFIRIVEQLEGGMQFFQQRPDATGRLGISALQKCTSVMRILAYGIAADACDEYLRLSGGLARQSLLHFVEGVITYFGDEYLRRPTSADIDRLLSVGASRGFPGMLGSIDCMHWGWKNCPTVWKGQFARGDHKMPTIILEAVASYDLWIWHAFFGVPGTCNDINVLDRSPVFDDVLNDIAPNVKFTVNGHEYNMGYYLTDGIYPDWATFIQSITKPQGPKAKLFAEKQESTRKDVERAFGVLQARFAIVRKPALSWDPVTIGKIMRACIILHNMIVEDERDNYTHHGYEIPRFDEGVSGEPTPVDESDFAFSTIRPDVMRSFIRTRIQLRDRGTHHRLKEDLKEHIWERFGGES